MKIEKDYEEVTSRLEKFKKEIYYSNLRITERKYLLSYRHIYFWKIKKSVRIIVLNINYNIFFWKKKQKYFLTCNFNKFMSNRIADMQVSSSPFKTFSNKK